MENVGAGTATIPHHFDVLSASPLPPALIQAEPFPVGALLVKLCPQTIDLKNTVFAL